MKRAITSSFILPSSRVPCKRDSDLLARVGGEEFALLLPETGPSEAEAVAERLREQVGGNRFPVIDHPATISVGVAAADENTSSISDLMKRADHALYAAKRGGRNKVVCCSPAAGADRGRNG